MTLEATYDRGRARLSVLEQGMEMDRPMVNATGDGEFDRAQLCSLLDELVAMRWDLSAGLRDNPYPAILTAHLRRVGDELDVAIDAMKALIGSPL